MREEQEHDQYHHSLSDDIHVQHKNSVQSPGIYQIRVEGWLDAEWSEWFNGWDIEHRDDLTTMLTGPISDQPELHGLLLKIRNLNLTLISVSRHVS